MLMYLLICTGENKKKNVNNGTRGYDQPDTDSDSDGSDGDDSDGDEEYCPPVLVVGVKGIPRDSLLEVEVYLCIYTYYLYIY